MLKNKAPKCFQVKAPSGKLALIKFYAPDLVILDDEDEKEGLNKQQDKSRPQPADGLDAMYNDRMQRRMESLKKAHLKDINISVSPRDIYGSMIKSPRRDAEGQVLPRKIRHQVEGKEGSFEFQLDEQDVHLEICVQAYTAALESPSRVAIDVVSASEEESDSNESGKSNLVDSAREREILEKSQQVVKTQTSRISAELLRMQRRASAIASDADFAKKREAEFREKSVSLNKAVRYYPMFRMLVLLLAGFFQVSSVVQFMKRKHIY